MADINLATKLVIPAAAKQRAGIQKRPYDCWIPTFARMTEWRVSVALFNCQFNNTRRYRTQDFGRECGLIF